MPFPYAYICDLLQKLEDETLSTKKEKTPGKAIIANWFKSHHSRLHSPDNDASAVLSTLLPERRTDRVYSIRATRLRSIIGRALLLGQSRVLELRRHIIPGSGVDLGDCVESILTSTPNPVHSNAITVEEVDAALQQIASVSRFSSPTVRATKRDREENLANRALGAIYVRLSARDAKWFTRLILKNYQPVVLSENAVLSSYHVLLPQLLKVRDDLTITTAFLRFVNQEGDDAPDRIASILKPQLGTKVGRQPWFKGRSIKHCLDMAARRNISVEQKIDGEYCQVHIDLSKGHKCIQIFSKSGKDSTADRAALHPVIRQSLKLGKPDCPIKQGCILEGELVVYSNKENKILPFHKIRKHVSRSGSFLGIGMDSQPHDYEHLMIIYYDVLMIDNQSFLNHPLSRRRERLHNLITYRKGCAEIVPSQTIACSKRTAAAELREAFAKCILSRSEGIVLKPDTPYFDFSTALKPYACCNIKLKKEYIQGWGDVGDFAVIGAGYDAAQAKSYKISNLKWTYFYVGCLQNRQQVRLGNELPRFIVVNIVEINETLMKSFRAYCNTETMPLEEQEKFRLELHGVARYKPPVVIFNNPVVFDIRCFSFDKEPNTNFWSMRFPMVSKIHFDRSYMDAITFEELQEAAAAATDMTEQEDSQELRSWIRALENADPRGIAVDAVSQQTTSSDVSDTGSPRRENAQEHVSEEDHDVREGSSGTEPALTHPSTSQGAALPTPPTSSAAQQELASSLPVPGAEFPRLNTAKRTCDSNDDRGSKKRNLSYSESVVSLSLGMSQGSAAPASTKARQPLSQINQNASPVATAPAPAPSTHEVNTSKNGEAAERPMQTESVLRRQPAPSNTTTTTTTTRCSLAGRDCALANRSILLSPCIVGYAWVTQTLLSLHGIASFHVDPATWTHDSSSAQSHGAHEEEDNGSSSSAHAPHSSEKNRSRRRRARKICLVEARREDATRAFLARIEDAGLRTRGGRREWVAVYNWRVLEKLTELETETSDRSRSAYDYDPWRQFYFGIA